MPLSAQLITRCVSVTSWSSSSLSSLSEPRPSPGETAATSTRDSSSRPPALTLPPSSSTTTRTIITTTVGLTSQRSHHGETGRAGISLLYFFIITDRSLTPKYKYGFKTINTFGGYFGEYYDQVVSCSCNHNTTFVPTLLYIESGSCCMRGSRSSRTIKFLTDPGLGRAEAPIISFTAPGNTS